MFAKIVRSRRFKQRFDIIIEQHKDYHKTLDSSSSHLSAHNVYYVKCNLMVSQFMALSIWRSLECLPFPNPASVKASKFSIRSGAGNMA